MSITIRFVDINRDTKKVDICENFLGFIPVDITIGQELTNAILSELRTNKIPIQDMPGQGYDNGSNMKGHHSGVQKKMLDLNSRAFFVPCHAHTLNLVVNDTAKSSTGASKFLIQIQAIFSLNETRWESRIDAIKPFRYQTGEIFDALYEISQDISFDQITQLEAKSIAKQIKNFNCVLRYAKTIALELDIEASFTQQTSIRPRKKKTVFFSYEQPDEPIINIKTKFKVDLYIYNILDVALNSLKERFEQLHNHCDNFKCLYNINSLKSIMKDNIVENCMDLQLLLSENENVCKSAKEMTDELVAISGLLKPNSTPLKFLKFIVNNNNFARNVAVALCIILTMPVSVASGEQSFSKLKIIKNYLRSSMNQKSRISNIKLHSQKRKHVLAVSSSSNKLTSFFINKAKSGLSDEKKHITTEDDMFAFHIIMLNHSFCSMDCTYILSSSLIKKIKKLSCAQMKCELIRSKVIIAFAMKQVLEEFKNNKFATLTVDKSNHKNQKLVPIIIRYSNPQLVQIKVLEFANLQDETTDIFTSYIIKCFEEIQLIQ
ncbi:Ribonuclease H-like domain,HAT, C-terminal dimerisation domain,Domain of unknown function DUF4371 [Cinara cedri]|uniref:HAT C-terminal dimerisation domain-containing protein n=1 Tax=Cinara cedri TaxID=506608 RepID=A0A5E4N957_9HEMI|nr:Ribonuclease H-like domain,HAT, C-terminal dimerisation domain,Domain of unknown function DUF4371 [Cinara cedri]